MEQDLVSALQNRVTELEKELAQTKDALKEERDKESTYKSLYMKKCEEINDMKGDMQLVAGLFNKLTKRW